MTIHLSSRERRGAFKAAKDVTKEPKRIIRAAGFTDAFFAQLCSLNMKVVSAKTIADGKKIRIGLQRITAKSEDKPGAVRQVELDCPKPGAYDSVFIYDRLREIAKSVVQPSRKEMKHLGFRSKRGGNTDAPTLP